MDYPNEIFWSRVDKSGDCLIWTMSVNSDGYGNFCWNKRVIKAHRVAYELIYGLIGGGMQLDHLCRNRRCVNPEHLEEVTQAENLKRGVYWQKLKTHCKHGHTFDEKNTYINKQGWRHCRQCKRNYY